jgi:hypothetical protein
MRFTWRALTPMPMWNVEFEALQPSDILTEGLPRLAQHYSYICPDFLNEAWVELSLIEDNQPVVGVIHYPLGQWPAQPLETIADALDERASEFWQRARECLAVEQGVSSR